MLYVDLLDTVKCANGGDENIDWWRPKSVPREKAIALAEAGMISQILMGETIGVTNNQLIDSVSLLRLIPKLKTLTRAQEPPVVAKFYGKGIEPRPESLVEIAFRYFDSSIFLTSAWSPLTKSEAQQIARNLLLSGNHKTIFSKMLRNINLTQEMTHLKLLAENLQYLFEYLKNWQKKQSACGKANEPKNVKRISIWEGLENVKDHRTNWGINGEMLKSIEDRLPFYAARCNKELGEVKELRSILYSAIGDVISDEFDKDWIRGYVDIFYNSRIAQTTTESDGVFTMSDVVTPICLDDQIRRLILSNTRNPDNISFADIDIDIQPQGDEIATGLTWEMLNFELLDDSDYQNKVENLRENRFELKEGKKDQTINVQDLQNNVESSTKMLIDFISKKLGPKIVQNSERPMDINIGIWLKEGISLLPHAISAYFSQRYQLPLYITEPLAIVVEKWLERSSNKILDAYAAGQIRGFLESWSL